MRDPKRKKKALRIDRPLDGSPDLLAIVDLEILQRSARESLLVARLFRRRATTLRGPGSPAR